MGTVGIVVNPNAGKDIRRLVSAAAHTSDVSKIGIVRRAIVGAAEAGAERILLNSDRNNLAARAAEGLKAPVEFIDTPGTGSRLDTVDAATELWKEQAGAVVVLGGDGTCRDVATGWPDIPMVALSTGTNNVFPNSVDSTSAGVAAALFAAGSVDRAKVACRAKRISITSERLDEVALVEVALISTSFVGARAVTDAGSVRAVVACIAEPAATGLASIAGRVNPLDRSEPGAVALTLGSTGSPVRVPLVPGAFATVHVESVEHIDDRSAFAFVGPGTLAFDGERHVTLGPDESATARVDRSGPWVIDVHAVLRLAAAQHLFFGKEHHGH